MRKNPRYGSHPDLFTVESPYFKGVEEFTEEELVHIPINDFGDNEFNALDEDIQEQIVENDADSKERRDALFDLFWMPANDRDYLENNESEIYVELFHQELAGGRVGVPKDVMEQFRERYPDRNENDIEEAILDTNLWKDSVQSDNYGAHWYYEMGSISGTVDVSDYRHIVSEMAVPDIELELVRKRLWKEKNLDIPVDAFYDRRSIDYEIDVSGYYVVFELDEDALWQALADSYEPEDIDEDVTMPPEERVVYRFKDGFYVLDLLPSELAEEGEIQGICVGDPGMGYRARVKQGTTKIFSLRRPSGKPLFTIEASVKPDDEPVIEEINQIKGKANRLPGWDSKKTGIGEPKFDEVQKVVEFVESIGIDPLEIHDLKPAMLALEGKLVRKNPDNSGPCVDHNCDWCRRAMER